MPHTTTAIIFVLSQYLLPDADRCIRHCLANGYSVVGVVKDNWRQAMEYLNDGTASVLVVADPRHLDPQREPRIEVVAEGTGKGRRTRIVRGTGAA